MCFLAIFSSFLALHSIFIFIYLCSIYRDQQSGYWCMHKFCLETHFRIQHSFITFSVKFDHHIKISPTPQVIVFQNPAPCGLEPMTECCPELPSIVTDIPQCVQIIFNLIFLKWYRHTGTQVSSFEDLVTDFIAESNVHKILIVL